ncbi:unnamed protein product, partial [Symbiodinium sp. KB8]
MGCTSSKATDVATMNPAAHGVTVPSPLSSERSTRSGGDMLTTAALKSKKQGRTQITGESLDVEAVQRTFRPKVVPKAPAVQALILQALAQNSLLDALGDEERNTMMQCMTSEVLPVGQSIIKQ